ncbi:MAG: hypothetical protein HQ539_02510 [Parcubacteria group bacterium]|nr:hypothetical protein [Parcubacteria group bacterium]
MPSGMFALSVGQEYKEPFRQDAFLGSFYQQHFSEDYGGFAFLRGSGLDVLEPKTGLFRPNFESSIQGLNSDITEAVGYCGPSSEPRYPLDSKLGRITGCFSGNVSNCAEQVDEFKAFGHTFVEGDDIEVILRRIIQGSDIADGILSMSKVIEGSYALIVMSEKEGGMYAVSYPGHWPLIVGVKKGTVALATDPSGFNNLGLSIERELEPGEIVFIKNGELKTCATIPGAEGKVCGFLFWYSAFPAFVYRGVVASEVREASGALLAKRDIEAGFIPDVVTPISYSGDFHAQGYMQEFCRSINAGLVDRIPLPVTPLIRYPYAGRSFTPQDAEARAREAFIKQVPSSSRFRDIDIKFTDDSIVRGTQLKGSLIPKLRALGFTGVHAGISYAELVRGCHFCKAAKEDGDLLAIQHLDLEERKDHLGLTGLDYNTLDDLIKVLAKLGLPEEQVCLDCARRRETE